MGSQEDTRTTILLLGAGQLPPRLHDGFFQTYKVLTLPSSETEDLDRLKPEELDTVEGVLIYDSHGRGRISGRVLDRLPHVRTVSTGSAGTNHIDKVECRARNITIGHAPELTNGAVADMTWGLVLAACRHVVLGHKKYTSEDFKSYNANWFGKEVHGSTLGIVGMGGIGFTVARRSLGFDMKVLYHNRNRRDAGDEKQVGAEYVSDLKELMARSDIVVCCVPATPETRHLFNDEVFSSAKQDAVFVNISRGSLVDQDALVSHLKKGHLFAAGLDVTDPEPLPRDHPLLHMDNVTVTPHVAGYGTEETATKMVELTLRNLAAGLEGKPLEAPAPN